MEAGDVELARSDIRVGEVPFGAKRLSCDYSCIEKGRLVPEERHRVPSRKERNGVNWELSQVRTGHFPRGEKSRSYVRVFYRGAVPPPPAERLVTCCTAGEIATVIGGHEVAVRCIVGCECDIGVSQTWQRGRNGQKTVFLSLLDASIGNCF